MKEKMNENSTMRVVGLGVGVTVSSGYTYVYDQATKYTVDTTLLVCLSVK